MDNSTIGQPIPLNTAHAVSVSLPTWNANIGYEEGEDWVLSRMMTGYPRFFLHKSIEAFASAVLRRHGSPSEHASLFHSHSAAVRCVQFFHAQISLDAEDIIRIIDLYPNDETKSTVSAVLFPKRYAKIAKAFWQHTGEGISSRRAEYCHKAFDDGRLTAESDLKAIDINELKPVNTPCKGPRRYRKPQAKDTASTATNEEASVDPLCDARDSAQFVEERFGRNLDLSLATSAKLAIRRRIAGALTANVDLPDAPNALNCPFRTAYVEGFSEDDVYLFPCGMNSIFHSHRLIMACRGECKSISYGFPYIDTLKVLQKFGPGCRFYGHGSESELDDLEEHCVNGEKFLALFCEFPGNPLLKTPNILRIRSLADRFDFAVVIDETIGNFVNVHVLPYADIVVSSLTKVFTGECNVMGGSLVLNPQGHYYKRLKEAVKSVYEDNYWPEDAIFMERNSRDFVTRVRRINANAEAICDALLDSPIVKQIYYPKHSPTKPNYDECRNVDGGYGGLLSVTFTATAQAIVFFDELDTAKGPSLGTNFTLSSPYVLLAHYGELDWSARFGVDADLVRMSVGLEDTADLVAAVQRALVVAERVT